jgi:hypothetical protein
VTQQRKGHRLAVSLPPRWPRWGSLLLSSAVTIFYLGFMLFAIYGSHEEAHRVQMLTVLCGGIGLVCVVCWVRDLVRWVIAGDTIVEVSQNPAQPGQSLDFFVLQTRDHSRLRRLEARIVCRRQVHRAAIEEIHSLTLGTPEMLDRQGRRAQIQSSVELPADAPVSIESEPLKIRWCVEVRALFGRSLVFLEEHPFTVVLK